MTDEEFYAQLNTVNLASGALIRDHLDRVLIVNPNYKVDWLIPGGSVDKDEAPSECCKRELKEELGLDLPIGPLLSMEYLARRDFKPEAIHFVFDAGILSDKTIANIKLCNQELIEFKLCPIDEACQLLEKDLAVRFRAAFDKIGSAETNLLERGVVRLPEF